jgi:hypothetical protein
VLSSLISKTPESRELFLKRYGTTGVKRICTGLDGSMTMAEESSRILKQQMTLGTGLDLQPILCQKQVAGTTQSFLRCL